MKFYKGKGAAATVAGAAGFGKAALAAAILIAVVLSALARVQTAAKAAPPGPLELVERVLASDVALEDEGPYRLIDPVGPGGLRRADAIAAVTSPTMQTAPAGGERTPYGQYAPDESLLMMLPPGPNVTHGAYHSNTYRHGEQGDRDHDHGSGYGGRR
ncbi:MAG: hypothetical protein DLM53_09325 [Candidatus Eremiobacter antarcticus]|nr:hypothetical protein [Candidatus Eremiobacteraeota bacterium]MBC5807527.1 hypothetical protein [Candidatus Eremiobacteraeota bacterium]PZR61420.1 MAG: hypothetical protein DLM53_09325 [Candidatus Eremiobacter sp. RRmetagenome_bin22]